MLRKAYLLKLFPIVLLWVGAGLCSIMPIPFLHKNLEKNLVMEMLLAAQVLLWLGLGYFLYKIYISTYKDELTGLWNRRYLYVRLRDEIKKADEDKILCLAIIDIDNFKGVNDCYGHLFGDKVLKEIAGILENNLRKTDIIARWGGEEMMIALPKTGVKGALKVVERIREKIERFDFGCSVTVSGGIAFIDGEIETDKLIEMADKALYKAKKRKNRIAVYKKNLSLDTP